MNEEIAMRPTLRSWLESYKAIERDCLSGLVARGVALAPFGSHMQEVRALKGALRARGICFLNGEASLSRGFLSDACRACVGGCGSRTFYINLRCDRTCYFCFNPNQADYEKHRQSDAPWRVELEEFSRSCAHVTHIALTGGEPLLCKEKTYEFFSRARELNPDAHLRLYTSGTSFDEACCDTLADCGLDEIRFSIKLDEGEESIAETLRRIGIAVPRIPDVMVEMPVVPGTTKRMEQLLAELDARGVRGVNLLEFCFPLRNWSEFEQRGFKIKNPPFDVLYDYEYAGGLPVAGSEEACLSLLLYAEDVGLGLGVHYCSLENKNRDQILCQNRAGRLDAAVYELDANDWFYKTCKVFDGDVDPVRRHLEARGCSFSLEEDGACLAFHPSLREDVVQQGALVANSFNVIQEREGDTYVRELKLALSENQG